jgi:hypothetical protein
MKKYDEDIMLLTDAHFVAGEIDTSPIPETATKLQNLLVSDNHLSH